jgi:hypothetical protein
MSLAGDAHARRSRMMILVPRRAIRAALLCIVVATAVGCRGCFCTNVFHAMTDKPPEGTVREEVEKRLPTAREVASELCGIPVEGLQDVVVRVVSQTLATSTVHVEGTPIVDDPDTGEEIDVKKALVCAGALTVLLVPLFDGDGKATGWKLSTMEVSGIETEGVHFDKSQHQHHHHHHH